jgi:hypothetical protein
MKVNHKAISAGLFGMAAGMAYQQHVYFSAICFALIILIIAITK